MAYTDVWDVTSPLDTQAANQGAADFRATKLDIMQRVASFGAGLLANRPTPETTSGTADWTGVMYWATDTKQAFMWNGSAWVDISADVPSSGATFQKYTNVTPNTLTDNGSIQTGITLLIPANAMTVGSVFKIKARTKMPAAGSATPMSTISLFLGGVNMVWYPLNALSPGVFASDQFLDLSAEGICTGASAQEGYGFATLGIMANPSTGEIYEKPFDASNTLSAGINVNVILGSEKSSGTSVIFQNLSVLIF